MAKRHGGLRSIQALKNRKRNKANDEHRRQRETEQRLKSELLHKLETLLIDNDAVEIEIPNVDYLPYFVLILNDPSVSSLYDFEQVSESLYIFRPKAFM